VIAQAGSALVHVGSCGAHAEERRTFQIPCFATRQRFKHCLPPAADDKNQSRREQDQAQEEKQTHHMVPRFLIDKVWNAMRRDAAPRPVFQTFFICLKIPSFQDRKRRAQLRRLQWRGLLVARQRKAQNWTPR
jgi:hypothetical protein